MQKLLSTVLAAGFFSISTAYAIDPAIVCSKILYTSEETYNLISFTLLQSTQSNTYTLTEKQDSRDIAGRGSKSKTTLGHSMKCAIAEDLSFECSVDRRAVDGPMDTFTLVREEKNNSYKLVHYSEHFNRIEGKASSTTKVLSEELSCEKEPI